MKFIRFFILTGLVAGAATLQAQSVQIVSGHGQVIQEQFLALKPFTLRMVNAAGQPVADVPVTWSVTPFGAGSLAGPAARTNAQGEANTGFFASSNPPGVSFTPATITASTPNGIVNFALVVSLSRGTGGNLVPLPFVQPKAGLQGSTIEGAAGTVLRGAVSVTVVAQGGISLGKGIPNVGLRVEPLQPSEGVTATCNAPAGIVLTGEDGIATCDLVLGNVPGFVQMKAIIGEYWENLRFDLRITPGPTCTFSLTPAAQGFGDSGGSGVVSVSAGAGCSWNAFSSASWISIASGASGQGNGSLTFSVAPNLGAQRTGTLTIGNQNVTVTQAAMGATGGASLAFSVASVLPSATTGLPYSVGLTATGGSPPYRWTASTNLPSGLALNAATGIISGTSSTAGNFSIPVTVTDALNVSFSQTFTLVVNQAAVGSPTLIFTTSSFPTGTPGVPYEQPVLISGGCQNPFAGPPTISLASGALPPGLSLQSLSGGGFGVAGTPSSAGTYSFALRAVACTDATAREFTITIGGTPTGPSMMATPAELQFTTLPGGVTRPADQTVSISTGSVTMSFGASVSTTSGGNWLAVSPSLGQTPATLTVSIINLASLVPGNYRGTITVLSQASNSPTLIPVSLSVPAVGTINLSTSSLRFDHTLNSLTVSEQTIAVTSSSGEEAAFTSSTTAQWLTVSPASGQTPANVRIIASSAVLLPGVHDAFVSFAPVMNPAGVRTLHVIITVANPPIVQPTVPLITSVTNAASFEAGAVASGEFVTIFGLNIGPVNGVAFRLTPAGSVESTLAETRVLFDDVPAPMIYTSTGQISAIAPYTLAGRTRTRVIVEYRGVRSLAADVAVAESAPGIFTVGGTVQAAIVNQDGTVNGLQGAAPAGSVVSIYATGEGIIRPALVEGTLANANVLARPVLPVRVQIGGQEAEVQYAGVAPGLLVGVLQVNARVPENAIRGNDIPVVLTVGANSSGTATMAIR